MIVLADIECSLAGTCSSGIIKHINSCAHIVGKVGREP